MASGCILGQCPLCGDHIWEDEEYIIKDNHTMYHTKCKKEIKSKLGKFLKKEYYEILHDDIDEGGKLEELCSLIEKVIRIVES